VGTLCQFRTSLTSAGLVLEHSFSCDSPGGQNGTTTQQRQQQGHIATELLKQVLAVVRKVRACCRALLRWASARRAPATAFLMQAI
jgi:hypothetical protein